MRIKVRKTFSKALLLVIKCSSNKKKLKNKKRNRFLGTWSYVGKFQVLYLV